MPETEPLTPEQEEEQRAIWERRERFRQNYLKQASGKQQEYDRKYAEKHKARLDAKRAMMLEDGAVLGARALAPVAVGEN